jgi:hypothetical protein
MLYINPTPHESGVYYPPQTTDAKGLVKFPDEFLETLQTYNGFVVLTIENDTDTAIAPNAEAWEEWKATQPIDEPTEPSTENEAVTWAELDAAYSEGVNTAYEQ